MYMTRSFSWPIGKGDCLSKVSFSLSFVIFLLTRNKNMFYSKQHNNSRTTLTLDLGKCSITFDFEKINSEQLNGSYLCFHKKNGNRNNALKRRKNYTER